MKIMKAVSLALLAVVLASAVMAAEQKPGTIKGKLALKDGTPLAGGLVFFFNQASGPPPFPEKYWRVPDEIAELNAEGGFSTELLSGIYYLGAIKRLNGRDVGPPSMGDQFLVSRDPAGKPRTFKVGSDTMLDVGTLAEGVPYKKIPSAPGDTGIDGIVLDPDAKPVQGVFVFAFLTPAMVGRPLFVSEKTGSDGRFTLRVAGSGTYYLKVRELYGGGPPGKGSIIGGYGAETPTPVVVRDGTLSKDIKIKGGRFQGQGKGNNE